MFLRKYNNLFWFIIFSWIISIIDWMASARPFQDKVIAITGAVSDMSLATAHYLAACDASLSVTDIQDDLLKAVTQLIKNAQSDINILITVIDVCKPSEVNSWITSTISAFSKLDSCTNLASVMSRINHVSNIAELEDEEWNYIMTVNLNSVFHCVRAELKYLAKRDSIVNTASVAELMRLSQSTAYSVSKHGVVDLTRSIAKKLKNLSIQVNCICSYVFW